MKSSHHFPEHILDHELIMHVDEPFEKAELENIFSYKPEIVIITLHDTKPENSKNAQDGTLIRLKDNLEKNGKRTAILYCRTYSFSQEVLSSTDEIKTLVFLGVKPYNLELVPSQFYSKTIRSGKNIIVANTIYQMDHDSQSSTANGLKRRLWEVLMS